MSESYTTGGDTLQSIDSPHLAGQTFHPKESHVLEFIDLEMRGAMYINDPVIQIFFTDSNHEPYGECLSRDLWIVEKKSGLFAIGRVRFKMQPLLLVPGLYYCIWAGNFPVLLGNPASWQYDAGDASYPGGIRISSSDSGETWTKHYNDDHIFAEFGDPPLPTPEPPPPIDNFAILGMHIRYFANAILFRHSTSVPCHLTLYWTDKEPLTHHQSRVVRGLAVPWRTYFCFVAWHEVEQEEPGDTLYHSFDVTPWPACQTRWYTIRGEVDDILSPSVGPIFKQHNDFIPWTLYEHYITGYVTSGHIMGTWWSCQTFTPSISHKITSAKFKLWREGAPGILHLDLRATNAGKPTGPVLASGNINGTSLGSEPGAWTEIQFSESYTILAGTLYSLTLRAPDGGTSNKVRVQQDTLDASYPGGTRVTTVNGGSTWTIFNTMDYLFEEWGLPP